MSLFEYNRNIFVLGLEGYLRKVVMPFLTNICEEAASKSLNEIDKSFVKPRGNMDFPIDTGNMRDGTGLAVYSDGAMREYVLPQYATFPQQMDGIEGEIWGTDLLEQAIVNSQADFSKNIWVVLFSTVPYAMLVDLYMSPITDRGMYFFGNFQEVLVKYIKEGLDRNHISYQITNIKNDGI